MHKAKQELNSYHFYLTKTVSSLDTFWAHLDTPDFLRSATTLISGFEMILNFTKTFWVLDILT